MASELLQLGLVQLQPSGSVDDNLCEIDRLVKEAVDRGATFVALPEYATCLDGRRTEMQAAAEQAEKVRARIAQLARSHCINLLLGSYVVPAADGRMFNRSLLIDPNGFVTASYDKLHMFDAVLPNGKAIRESSGYVPGREAVLARAENALVGLSICYDLRFPYLYRTLAAAGAQVLFVPSAFAATTGPMHWEPMLRARAIENRAFLAAPATCGASPGDRPTHGRSCIVDPEGAVVAQLDEEAGVLVHAIDLERVAAARARMPSLEHTVEFTLKVVDVQPSLRPAVETP